MGLLLACATCFGAADSDQVKAAKVGVLVLLGFIVPLLVAIASIARTWAKRARELASSDQPRSAPSFRDPETRPAAFPVPSVVELKT
jgi:hypothetical protein